MTGEGGEYEEPLELGQTVINIRTPACINFFQAFFLQQRVGFAYLIVMIFLAFIFSL